MLNLFIRQPLTESNQTQQKIIQNVINNVLEIKDELNINLLTPSTAQTANFVIANLINTYNKNQEINEDLLRHMVLNSLRSCKMKFGEKYGDLVI